MPTLSFVHIWTVILAIGVFFYVALDGFDLGVGMLYNFAPDRSARDRLMNSIAPIWDGNETWLILGSVGLFAAFPLAFAIIIPAVYFPILLMLLALIFRGVAFEFRYRDAEHRTFWDHGFAYGSALATFSQGAWSWVPSSRGSTSKGDASSAARSIASRPFRSSPVSL
jgi:cytochrome d ubiquinol oxidase subunit II